jgi:Flp pilus assembly protein TadD
MRSAPLRHLRATLPLVALLALGGCSAGSLSFLELDSTVNDEPSPSAEASLDLDVLLRIAESSRLSGDLAGAERVYSRAHELHPEAAGPLIGLAQVLGEGGAHADAVHHLQDALVLAPYNEDAHAALGKAFLGAQAPDDALQAFEKLTSINPNDPRGWNGAGVALDNLGRHEEAQDSYRTGLAHAPEYMSLRNNLGLSLALTGDHEAAIQMLRTAAGEASATPRTRQNLALALGLAGDLDAARQIGALDLPPEVVDRNLAFFAARRDKAAARNLAERQLAFVPRGTAEVEPPVEMAAAEPEAVKDAGPTKETTTAALAAVKPAAGLPMELSEQLHSNIPVPPSAPEARALIKAPPKKPSIAAVIQPTGDSAQAISARAPYGLYTFLDRLSKFDQHYEIDQVSEDFLEASAEALGALPNLVVHRDTTGSSQNHYVGYFPQLAVNNKQTTSMAAIDADVLQNLVVLAPSLPQSAEFSLQNPPVSSLRAVNYSDVTTVKHDEKPLPALEMTSEIPASAETTPTPTHNAGYDQLDSMAVDTPAPAEKATVASAEPEDYQVQISSHRSAKAARDAWQQISGRNPALFEGIQPSFSRADLGPAKGVYYRARTEPVSKADARTLCDALRAGGTACLLVKVEPEQISASLSVPGYPALPAAPIKPASPA